MSRYFYDTRVHLVPEIDGVRMITGDSCEFLQKVPGKFGYLHLGSVGSMLGLMNAHRCHGIAVPNWVDLSSVSVTRCN